MDIKIYLYDNYDPYSVKILVLLRKCKLKFTLGTYSRKNMEYVSDEIGKKVRKLPQVVIDGQLIGGYFDLMEFLINKKVINFKGELNKRQNGKGPSGQEATNI